MRIKSLVVLIIGFLGLGWVVWFGYKTLFPKQVQILFKTQKPEKRDIQNIVRAEGSLEAQGTSKIGPLFTATVKKIHVKEGQKVTKGMLLAELENQNGGDAEMRRAKGALDTTKADLTFIKAVHKRNKVLYKAGQLSQESFEQSTQTYEKAVATVATNQATYDKEKFLYEQTFVRAPEDGVVVSIPVEQGQTVSPSAATPSVLFEIAKNLGVMKATLYIDESKIGEVKRGMATEITVDTYPYRPPWEGTIDFIGQSKAELPSAAEKQTNQVTYKAEILLNNDEGLLRQGMSVHAKTIIAEAKQVLAVPGLVFQLNSKVLEGAAKVLHYDFKPLDPEKKKALLRQTGKHPVKILWVVDGKSFVEKSVEIGVTDNAWFEILSGVSATDDIIADDMTASEEMKKIAKQIAGS
jgi:RND family efflux transporter MFP subunit